MALSLHQMSECGREQFVVEGTFIVVSSLFMIMRFWPVNHTRRRVHLDDVFVVVAYLGNASLTSVAFWAIANGLGKRIMEITNKQLENLVAFLLVADLLYLLSTTCLKMSMLVLLYRIYATPKFRRWCCVWMVFDAIYLVSFIPILLTNCIPLSQYWNPKPTGWCRDTVITDYATVGFNLTLDLAILILPLPVLWRLPMSKRDKMTVTALFSISLVTIASVLWRLVEIIRIRSSPDWTRSICIVGNLAGVEIWLSIIAVTIPTLGPFFNAYIRPVLCRLGLKKTRARSGSMPRNPDLETFGGSNAKSNRHSRRYLGITLDRTIIDDEPLKLTPTKEAHVIAKCAYEPGPEGQEPLHADDEIHVKTEIESVYNAQDGKDSATRQK